VAISKGYSIIEMLIAIGVFAIVGVVVTSSLASSFKNSKKSNAISNVKTNVDYAMSTMERLLRNAQYINKTTDTPPSTATKIYYRDQFNRLTYFECITGSPNYIASGSATVKLTSDQVIIDCASIFTYPVPDPGVPQIVEITLKGTDRSAGTTTEGATVTSKTRILLRYYED
jgi:prepilin-type N-terminal cleavage/methylation domain-containing protein